MCVTSESEFELPDSRHKYLYERLGDHEFQQLVGALLTHRFPDFVPLPLRQADGGRDGVRMTSNELIIYQVKWSSTGTEKKTLQWLTSTVQDEAANIKALAADGVTKYFLVTNVPSTGTRASGTFDRLNAEFDKYSAEFGLEMEPIWREGLDAMVDGAPTEIVWAYADMLAGWDLIRYLLSEQTAAGRDSELRSLLSLVAAGQSRDDRLIKFSQVELHREHLTDLYVDVTAERLQAPRRTRNLESPGPGQVGGAAAYLTQHHDYPFTLVLGAPGQGKSTLGQLVCQSFRAAFQPEEFDRAGLPVIQQPRFPLRVDLAEYAAWRQGFDVFDRDGDQPAPRGRRRLASEATLECFLAEAMTYASGGQPVTPAAVQDLFARLPVIVVLDGLDEVGSASARGQVVKAIDVFCDRGRQYAVAPRVVVTSRPNSAGLPQPDPDLFEVIALTPLENRLRDLYLRKWCDVHNVRGTDSQQLRRIFTQRTREPYIDELAGNPMQLTILLYLLHQRGDATPDQRTKLYDSYLELLLSREANKHPDSVKKHRNDLVEIVPFLGWYLQSRAEEHNRSARMSPDELKAAMKHFQTTYGKPETVVDELFDAATERLWALTSKEQGTFEFEVLSLREYFAARYLWNYAGEGTPSSFDRNTVFRELLRRPYWLNTTRFYAGNAGVSDLYVLGAGIKHELTENPKQQVRVGAWHILTDGVFNSRPYEAAEVVDQLTDDTSGQLLLDALAGKQINRLPSTDHTDIAWRRLTSAIQTDLDHPINPQRIHLLRDLLGLGSSFARWYVDHLTTARATPAERSWLRLGADHEAAAGLPVDVPHLTEADGEWAQLYLNTGAVPSPAVEDALIRAVLDGQCTETTSVRSRPAKLAVALSPAEFYAFGPDAAENRLPQTSSDRRSQALQGLRGTDPDYVRIAGLRRFRRGEKGTTLPWANVATALFAHTGRNWLSTEIAVIGAASPLRDGWTLRAGTTPFGPDSHPETLLAQTRKHAANISWWEEQRTACHDQLAAAEWALALWGIATPTTITALLPTLSDTINGLHSPRRRPLFVAAERLGQSGFLVARHVPSAANSSALLVPLLATRHPGTAETATASSTTPHRSAGQVEALAVTARRQKWLKVDQIVRYR